MMDNDTVRIFSEIGKALTSTLDIKEVMRIVLQKISEALEPSGWSLLLMNEQGTELRYELVINHPSVDRTQPVTLGKGLVGWVAQHGSPILWNLNAEPKGTLPTSAIIPHEVTSVLCVPLRSKNRALGVIELHKRAPSKATFTQNDLYTMLIIADFAAIAIENAHNFQMVQELTIIDDLTGLYNSRQLHRLLDAEVLRAARYHKEFSLIFLDLDKFKQVNDTHGHIHGSALIRETGAVLSSHIRTVDFAFRYGGDEFVVFMPETGKAEAMHIAERLRKTVQDHVFLAKEGLSIQFTASFGVATFPQDAMTKTDLIRMADEAMYKVKRSSRNRVETI